MGQWEDVKNGLCEPKMRELRQEGNGREERAVVIKENKELRSK
jgi:hypothetical protein